MDPLWLFPLLAVLFAGLALVRLLPRRRIDPAARTWGLLALLFALVAAWLHRRG